jgi:hypothetical protein
MAGGLFCSRGVERSCDLIKSKLRKNCVMVRCTLVKTYLTM